MEIIYAIATLGVIFLVLGLIIFITANNIITEAVQEQRRLDEIKLSVLRQMEDGNG